MAELGIWRSCDAFTCSQLEKLCGTDGGQWSSCVVIASYSTEDHIDMFLVLHFVIHHDQ